MAINNKPAEKYAKPHTMSGKPVSNKLPEISTETGGRYINEMDISVGNVSKGNYPAEKTTGVEFRGAGAATKGRKSYGPLA
jgi:hypothetical protein